MARFVWDPQKAAENRRKHGVPFEDAVRVFDDPLHLTQADTYPFEERWQTVGMPSSTLPLILFVVRAARGRGNDGEDEIRIISARRATPRERRAYEAGEF